MFLYIFFVLLFLSFFVETTFARESVSDVTRASHSFLKGRKRQKHSFLRDVFLFSSIFSKRLDFLAFLAAQVPI
jgi:preprotein translocase subunit SecY